jgi:starch synthase
VLRRVGGGHCGEGNASGVGLRRHGLGHHDKVRVVFVTAELSPVATVGGLAAAAAGLARELRRQGVDVDVVMPDYGAIELADESVVDLDVPHWVGPARLRVGDHADVGRLHLVDVPGMARSHPYLQPDGQGWPDNADRFFRFSRAVAAFVEADPPDVLHLNDWHTGAVLAALVDQPPTVLSIHNLAYQGRDAGRWLSVIGPRASHFEWWGDVNPLTGAIALADAVVAVSPHYVEEILTPEHGFGVDGPLRQRATALSGILNGIDTEVWDPATDRHLVAAYDRTDLTARAENRAAVLDRFGFPHDRTPLAIVVSRLTSQKGIDLLVPVIPVLDEVPVRLAVLGSGDAALSAELRYQCELAPDTVGFVDGYDEALSHLMFGGADLLLMPSRFEPCGLTQMQAMRYGVIPVVTAVGGLVDTVPDADADPKLGRGFVARHVEPTDVLAALFRAARRLGDARRKTTLQRRIMSIDWSWREPALEYRALYAQLRAR